MATLSPPANASSRSKAFPGLHRNTVIVLGVVLLHVGALWALQAGLLRRVVDMVVPAEILVEIMAPAAPPQPQVQAKAPAAKPTPPAPTPPVKTLPAPAPLAMAPSATTAPATPAAPTATAAAPTTPPSTGSAPSAPPAPPKVELPSTDADYLNNPKPPYPPLSKRLREQGRVIVRVLIGADGAAQQADIKQSSGFDRLDQSARTTALKWRYVPGKRGGVPEAMWFNVPFDFVLE